MEQAEVSVLSNATDSMAMQACCRMQLWAWNSRPVYLKLMMPAEACVLTLCSIHVSER